MCVAYLALSAHPDYPWVIALNRDEFIDRKSLPAQVWTQSPDIIAGIDAPSGGTWFGVTQEGRFVFVTNYRDFSKLQPDKRSRGLLTKDYLEGNLSPEDYLKKVDKEADLYNPFNLIVGNPQSAFYYSNLLKKIEPIANGIHGISNAFLNDPWPKVERGKAEMAKWLTRANWDQNDPIFSFLRDTTLAPDAELPDTGVGLPLERSLSSIFVDLYEQNYGTRSSTLAFFDRKGKGQFYEVTYDEKKQPHVKRISFGNP